MDAKIVGIGAILLIIIAVGLATIVPSDGGIITLGKPSGCNYDGSCQGWEDRTCPDCVGGETTTTPTNGETKPECNDKSDNDGDGWIDMDDSGCLKRRDNDETDCGDGVCEGPESCTYCPEDCGICPTTTTTIMNMTTTTTPITTTTTTIPPNSCSDTDGGWNVNLKGTVYGFYNGLNYSYTDFCTANKTLTEYYCSGGLSNSDTLDCTLNTSYCVNGACV